MKKPFNNYKTLFLLFLAGLLSSQICAQSLKPGIEANNQLIELRKDLQGADSLMKKGIFKDKDTGREYFTGYAYKTLYDWDQYFEAIVQIYMGWPSDYIKNGVTIFLDHQEKSGFIARSVPSNQFHGAEHVKPFLAQITMLVFDNYNDKKWFTPEYFKKMQQYLDYWLNNMDSDKDGLSEWMSAPHTGMDNQHERAGWWLDRVSEGVDLNSYLVLECKAFAKIAETMGEKTIATTYRNLAEKRANTIREILWDKKDGFFYDKSLKTNNIGAHRGVDKLIKVKSIAGFMPLWAGIATKEQARELVYNHLMNPAEFWTNYPVPALAKTEPGYSDRPLLSDLGCSWRANTWMPTNYMIYHGLKDYGYSEFASLLAVRTQQMMNKAGNREYYLSETGEGVGLNPFWGWSLLGHFFLYEDISKYDITKTH